jgi:hypothetical protein
MNAGSRVKLFWAGWQVPQVRPFPLNVSLKKISLPLETRSLGRDGGALHAESVDNSPTTPHRTTSKEDARQQL